MEALNSQLQKNLSPSFHDRIGIKDLEVDFCGGSRKLEPRHRKPNLPLEDQSINLHRSPDWEKNSTD